MESIGNLIDTLENLSSALSAKDKDKALGAVTLLLQQFAMTFGHAARLFWAILFLQTLKAHTLGGEFEEASGCASALLARLRAVNAAIKKSAARSSATNLDVWADDVLDDVINAEATSWSTLPLARGGEREAGTPGALARRLPWGNPFAAYPHINSIPAGPEPRLLACIGGFPSDPLDESPAGWRSRGLGLNA